MEPSTDITITPPAHVDAPAIRLQRVVKSHNLAIMGRAVTQALYSTPEVAKTCRLVEAAARRANTQEKVTYKGGQ